ncbi:MAG: hypothetical protein KGI59_02865 [Patescibacteria group bacterium]|nr:hypothetical protein [Patescibacteria group bacterium]MDE2172758.1 hypothetical protein [Patescibacteria group bacterium]
MSQSETRLTQLLVVLCISVGTLCGVIIVSQQPFSGQEQTAQLPYTVTGTGRDTVPPAVSIVSPVPGTVSGSVTILANVSDPVIAGETTSGVAAVQFMVDGIDLGQALSAPPYGGVWNTIGLSNGSHILSARATDAAGNSQTSPAVALYVSNAGSYQADRTPPSMPTNVTAAAVSTRQVNLTWSPSTDPLVPGQVTSGMAGYLIYRDGVQIASVSGTAYTDMNLNSGTTYAYAVAAFDANSPPNVSPQTHVILATTPTADQQQGEPAITNAMSLADIPVGVGQVTLRLVTDIPAVCKYSTVRSQTYQEMPSRFDYSGNLVHTTTVTGLADGQTYTYYVKCQSAAGIANLADDFISLTTLALPPESAAASSASAPLPVATAPAYLAAPAASSTASSTPAASSAPAGLSANPVQSRLPAGFQFPAPMSVNTVSEYARDLQIFLNDRGYAVAAAGVGSFGHETDYYGPATQGALASFQAAQGIAPAVGNFGPLTMARANQILKAGK